MSEQSGRSAAHLGVFPDLRRDVAFPVVGVGLLFGAFIAVGLLYQSFFSGAGERLVTIAMIDAIIVLGIQIYVGNTGVLSFGHIGFGAIAGYTFAIFAIAPAEKAKRIPDAPLGLTDVDMGSWGAVGVSIAVTVVVAIFVGIGLARSGAESGAVAATVITLALLFVTHEVARNWPEMTGGERAGLSFRIGGALDTRVPIYLALGGALVLARLFAQSRRGRLAKAGREDDLAARAMGVNPMVQQMIALLISVAVVSVGASLRVYETGSILPENFFFNYTLLTLAMLIVGGRNSVTGALFGVAVMTVGRELARRLGQDGFEVFGLGLDSAPLDWIFRENLQTVFFGAAMLGFMIWRPKGLLSDWEFDEWLHRRFTRAESAPAVPEAAMGSDRDAALEPEAAATKEARLEVTDVSVAFGGFQALSQSGFEVSSGEVVGIIGPNGAGKTTMLNVITGLVPATSGRVRLNGTDLIGTPSHEIARAGLVRTFQNLRLFDSLTVRENVEVTRLVAIAERDDRSTPETDVLVAAAGLWDHRDRRASELDYGNSRRLELARAAAARPLFLLLDEPTSGMSDTESLAMVEQVQTMAALVGAGVVVIDHDLDFIIGICDRIYCLDRGSVIASGTPEEIQADPAVQAAYLGSSAS
ncbi:ATP-binding cassette domain-containing protein [Candidatus Poriferisocius sp.]|uniref:branched-chain amino acid ABC transporter ATP-binding protein/permease n=1 Tax=Candidatus Poriferisocius sp. TaxID=3101276 RepID=UPI003B59A580